MCVKIKTLSNSTLYRSDIPLVDQIKESNEILVYYKMEKDEDVELFIEELERMLRSGVDFDMKVKVIHNNHLNGARAKKKIERLLKGFQVNTVVKHAVKNHANIDRELKDMVNTMSARRTK